MEKELGPEVIKATQTSLGKYVKRPPLSEKLLKKPPFRFLHDIVTSVLKTNGFFEGLFEQDELTSDNVKDRDSKILFLNKVITVIALTTGKIVSVKPSKIVAGQEPDKTNELLQDLAYCLDKKLTSDEAVQKYKESVEPSQATEMKTKEKETKIVKKNDTKKLTSKSSEKLASIKKESVAVNKSEKSKTRDPKSKRKEAGLTKHEQDTKKTQKLRSIEKKPSVESIKQPLINDIKSDDVLIQDNHEQSVKLFDHNIIQKEELRSDNDTTITDGTIRTENKVNEDVREAKSNVDSNIMRIEHEIQGKLDSSYIIGENDLNSSLSSQDLMEVENDKNVDNNVHLIDRPDLESNENIYEDRIDKSLDVSLKTKEETEENTALKRPKPVLIPKHNSFDSDIKAKELTRNYSHDSVVVPNRQSSDVVGPPSTRPPSARPPSARPSSSRPGAPRLREKIGNVIPENDNLILGKVNIIAENAQNDEEEDASVIIVEQQSGKTEETLDNQQDTLHLASNEHGHLVQQILNSQKELSKVAGKTEIEWQFGAQKAKEASNQEIEQLRFNIQALSRVANPLGKLLDHIQEDVEVMRQELQQWTNVYEEVSKDMIKQKAATEETLVPLQTRVKQLDVEIEEKRDKINDIKVLIHKNTTRIEKLLANGNVQ